VAQPRHDTSAVMRAAAGFHVDLTRRPVGKERHELGTFKHLTVNRVCLRLDIVNLKTRLTWSMAMVVGSSGEFRLQ
jgi:hypothetical protein